MVLPIRSHRAGHQETGAVSKLLFLGEGITGLAVDWRDNTVYWSSRNTEMIQQADTNGHNVKTVLRNLTQPSSVVIDPNAGFIFWLSAGVVSCIQRSDLSGGLISTLLKTPDRLLSLTADAVEMKLFWIQTNEGELDSLGSCNYNGSLVNVITQRLGMIIWTDIGIPVAVWRSGLDGEDRSVLIGSGLVSPCGIAVDYRTHTIYWSDIGAGRIESARLDGSQRHTLTREQMVWVSVSPSKRCTDDETKSGIKGPLKGFTADPAGHCGAP
ncbi:Pro-epidermal growth factor [Bagarius yarrelli]|uniref:Pro-epidermal growth factor n=1 Tax=Bagarius yarrelli TaxID=175774 RepID=A0A556U8W4_BAGYA|nr:Pro-epidermal growth factor [Bagarius yarrelli]